QRVHHLAVHVELELVHRRVADADGPGALVAGQPVQLAFFDAALARRPVQRLQLGRVAGDGPPQPLPPRRRLLGQPAEQQRACRPSRAPGSRRREACPGSLNGPRPPAAKATSATLVRSSPRTSTGVRSHTESGPATALSAPPTRRTHGTVAP